MRSDHDPHLVVSGVLLACAVLPRMETSETSRMRMVGGLTICAIRSAHPVIADVARLATKSLPFQRYTVRKMSAAVELPGTS
jgi:hypothetical protein